MICGYQLSASACLKKSLLVTYQLRTRKLCILNTKSSFPKPVLFSLLVKTFSATLNFSFYKYYIFLAYFFDWCCELNHFFHYIFFFTWVIAYKKLVTQIYYFLKLVTTEFSYCFKQLFFSFCSFKAVKQSHKIYTKELLLFIF